MREEPKTYLHLRILSESYYNFKECVKRKTIADEADSSATIRFFTHTRKRILAR